MIRPLVSALAVFLLGGLLALPAQAASGLRLLHEGDVRGQWEGCSCREGAYGSLSQRATLIKDLSGSDLPTLLLQVGNLLFPSNVPVTASEDLRRRLDALTVVDGMGMLGIAAANAGPLDLAAGLGFLKDVGRRSRFPWISANLRDSSSGELPLSPYVMLTLSQLRVGLVGVMPGGLRGAGWVTTDPVIEAREAVMALQRSGVERVVLLAAVGMKEASRIARRVPGLDAVVVAGDRDSRSHPATARRGAVVGSGSRGRTVGELILPAQGLRGTTVRLHAVSPSLPGDPDVEGLLGERRLRSPDLTSSPE